MSKILSDASVVGNKKRSRVVSKNKSWSDLDLSLTLHPIRKDVIPLRDDRAIKAAVKNLLLTNFFERPFQPSLGANLSGLLFEPADAITRVALRDNIRRVIDEHEPRVKILDIEVNNTQDETAYEITLRFLIKEYDTEEQVELVLRRIR